MIRSPNDYYTKYQRGQCSVSLPFEPVRYSAKFFTPTDTAEEAVSCGKFWLQASFPRFIKVQEYKLQAKDGDKRYINNAYNINIVISRNMHSYEYLSFTFPCVPAQVWHASALPSSQRVTLNGEVHTSVAAFGHRHGVKRQRAENGCHV